MKAPEFWRRGQGGLHAALLWPFSIVYALAGKLHNLFSTPWQAPMPVLCIGNVVAGGAGKTPVALDIARRLQTRGKSAVFISRGYGGSEAGPYRVNPDEDQAARTGDEPLLLARLAPTWISRDRVSGAKAASKGADIIIMDDGFQNPSVQKTRSVLVIDGQYGIGNGFVIPAGPLRETLSSALNRADVAVIIGEDKSGLAENIPSSIPLLRASILPGAELDTLKTRPVTAFAGIGHPEKFFDTLSHGGCTLVSTHAFADHHPYSVEDITALKAAAETNGSRLITTEKDLVRIPVNQREGIDVLTITLQWEDEEALNTFLDTVLQV